MECQGLMFHSFLYVKIVNYAEFLPYGVACYKKDCKIKKHNYVKMIEIKDSVAKIYRKPALYFIIVSFFLYSIHFLYTIEEIKKQDFQKKEI